MLENLAFLITISKLCLAFVNYGNFINLSKFVKFPKGRLPIIKFACLTFWISTISLLFDTIIEMLSQEFGQPLFTAYVACIDFYKHKAHKEGARYKKTTCLLTNHPLSKKHFRSFIWCYSVLCASLKCLFFIKNAAQITIWSWPLLDALFISHGGTTQATVTRRLSNYLKIYLGIHNGNE